MYPISVVSWYIFTLPLTTGAVTHQR